MPGPPTGQGAPPKRLEASFAAGGKGHGGRNAGPRLRAPGWVGAVARFNPVDWAVVAAREALSARTDWGEVWSRLGLLGALAVVMAWLATRAFGSYQRSL